MDFILHLMCVTDQLVPCVSLCVVHMCMITVFVDLHILLCAAENDDECTEVYLQKLFI